MDLYSGLFTVAFSAFFALIFTQFLWILGAKLFKLDLKQPDFYRKMTKALPFPSASFGFATAVVMIMQFKITSIGAILATAIIATPFMSAVGFLVVGAIVVALQSMLKSVEESTAGFFNR